MKEIDCLHRLAKEFSMSQEISVYDANHLYGEIGKYRFLQFSDDAVQGAIDLKDTKRIVLEYPRAIIHLMEYNDPSFERLFMIGHGIGTIAGHYSDKQVTVAEIDEKVVELSRQFFDYRRDNVVIGDGRLILSREEPDSFDYIVLDAFTKEGTPFHLTTMEFFKMAHEKLNARGSIIMNLMGKAKNDKLMNAIYTTLKETFAYAKAFSLPGKDVSDIRNIIVVGSNKAIDFQMRAMAGFIEIELDPGHVMKDRQVF
ncbi:spermidine synthase [Paenibacillus sp. PL91]|uniref:spermidine synthase n=1 Tax=Paenibacillus sp. PL91 TaxID=2729538 RepID=UPI001659C230|nr:fused MFS/spermidine synthase [Paenibacillus sp. PL91]MBC9203081.1 fused MFS/spermidine synthase [Paenibacillus sp. PL91]